MIEGRDSQERRENERTRGYRSTSRSPRRGRSRSRSPIRNRNRSRSPIRRTRQRSPFPVRNRSRSRSPVRRDRERNQLPERRGRSRSRSPISRERQRIDRRSNSPLDSNALYTREENAEKRNILPIIPSSRPTNNPESKEDEDTNKEKPNFGLSGLLTKESNSYRGVVIKYNEPPDAFLPKEKFRWYVYKNDKEIDMLPLSRQSAYLIGRDRKVADIPMDHASISKQHAVLQYRKVKEMDPIIKRPRDIIKPYIIDLESANGTFVNDTQIPSSRYFELKSKDVIKFAASTREYVFIKED